MPDASPAPGTPGYPDSPAAVGDAGAEAMQALARDLHAAADRARDERLRLAQAQKHQQDTLDQRGGPAPVDQVVSLTDKIKQLDQVVQDRLDTLTQTQRQIEQATERANTLRHVIQAATDAFAQEVERAQSFKHETDAAEQAVRDCAGAVAREVREQLAATEEPIHTRLKQLVEMDRAIDKRVTRMQQMHKQAAEAVDKHLVNALSSAKEQAAELAGPIKAELDRHLAERTEAIESAVRGKIAELDLDVEEALAPLTQRFDAIVAEATAKADALAADLPRRVEGVLDAEIDRRLGGLDAQAREKLVGLEADAAQCVESITQLAQGSAQTLAEALRQLKTEAQTQADRTEAQLRRRLAELRDGAMCMADLSLRRLEHRIREAQTGPINAALLDPRLQYDAGDLPLPAIQPVIQGPVLAESLHALGKRNARTGASTAQDAA